MSWKIKSLKLSAKGIFLKALICAGLKKVYYVCVKKCPEVFSQENAFLLKSLKNHFFWKKFFCLLLNTSLHLFEISANLRFFWYPLQIISKKFFSTLIRGVAIIFLEEKRSNKIETIQYIQKMFSYKLGSCLKAKPKKTRSTLIFLEVELTGPYCALKLDH